MADTTYLRDLGDGLILRRATRADTDALADFDARVHSDSGWDTPDVHVGAWVRDLMSGAHPTFDVGDFLVVEDTAQGTIVSSTNLISQTWSYAGMEFGVGRPELVGTHPDYRRRGLVRSQFEVLHQWSAERGHKVQAITGIAWYYRQFGYEMAVDLHGGRGGPVTSVPMLREGEVERYHVRPAEVQDLDFIADVDAHGEQRRLLRCVRDAALWRYELSGHSPESAAAQAWRIIETSDGEAVGFLAHPNVRWGNSFLASRYELKPGTSWWSVTPTVLRYLKTVGAELAPYASSSPDPTPFTTVGFLLGTEHPAYTVAADWLLGTRRPWAWYIRVPDVPDFLSTIAPVLEERLAASALVGHSGTLTLSFYRDGVKLVLEGGRLVSIEPWQPTVGGDEGMARFPGLVFLQLLFGYRSFAELDHAFPDCFGNREARLLLDVLFPKQTSDVWPIA